MVALKRKQVFISTVTTMRNPETNLPITRLDFNLESIGAQILKQVVQNTQDIQELKESDKETNSRVSELEKRIAELEAKLNSKEEVGD